MSGDPRAAHFESLYRSTTEPWRYSARGAEVLRHDWIGEVAAACEARLVLDVGCSAGQLTARLVAPGRRVLAVDVSPTAAARAAAHVPGAIGVSASALALPFATGGLDLVVASDGLLSWRLDAGERAQAVGELRRVLRPGGTAILTDHLRPRQFDEFVAVVAGGFRVERVEYLSDLAWYRMESWFKAVRGAPGVGRLLASRGVARGLARLTRPLGARASRHICVVARAA